jgi:hypothetical protein
MIAGDEIRVDAFLGRRKRARGRQERHDTIFSIPISAWFDYRAILTF